MIHGLAETTRENTDKHKIEKKNEKKISLEVPAVEIARISFFSFF